MPNEFEIAAPVPECISDVPPTPSGCTIWAKTIIPEIAVGEERSCSTATDQLRIRLPPVSRTCRSGGDGLLRAVGANSRTITSR